MSIGYLLHVQESIDDGGAFPFPARSVNARGSGLRHHCDYVELQLSTVPDQI